MYPPPGPPPGQALPQPGPPPATYGPQPAPRRPRRWGPLQYGVAIGSGAVLVGSLLTAFLLSGDNDIGLDGDGTAPSGWDSRVVDLVDFVERERGLEFDHPVQIDFVSDDEFRDELTDEDLADDLEMLEDFKTAVPMLRALGLMGGDLDLFETVQDFHEQAVGAFYDPEDKRIVVPATELSTYDEIILVHELTHALQDQHFDLESLLSGDDESEESEQDGTWAIHALVEGDANRIDTAYAETLSRAEREQMYEAGAGSGDEFDPDDFPSYLIASFVVPYTLGEAMAEAIALDGGNAAVDEAFAAPPSTGTHLLDPQTFLDDQQFPQLDVPDLPAGAESLDDEGELDALDIYFMLAQRIDLLDALEAADAWHGGSYTFYEMDDRVCVRAVVSGETDGLTEVLHSALEEWAEAGPDAAEATVELARDQVELETCDPGPDTELTHDRATEALTIAYLRSAVSLELVTYMGLDHPEAWDAAECVVAGLLADDDLDLSSEWSEADDDRMVDITFGCVSL